MPQRRRATLAMVATLYARLAKRLRVTMAVTAALSGTAKLVPVVIAMTILAGDARGAAVAGGVGMVIMAATRLLSSSVRVSTECDVHRAVVRAVLEGDVLVEPTSRPLGTLFEPMFHARTLLTDTVPELGASALAAVVVAPVLAGALPGRALVVSALAVVVVMAALVWVSRTSSRLQSRVWREQEKVYDRATFAFAGRLELAARGAEEDAMRSLEAAIGRYRGVARSGAWASALLGRAPLAAGLAAVVVVLVLDASSRDAVTSAVFAQALVLAATLPILLGLVLRVNELLRISAMIDPLVAVLAAPRRRELTRAGAQPPSVPTTITAHELTFSYEAGAAPTLRGVSFEWKPGTALLVRGPNGAGKSTLMRLLLGLREPRSGSLSIGGADLSSLDLTAFRRRIGYLPQRPYLGEPQWTVQSALRVVAEGAPETALRSVLSRVALDRASPADRADVLEVPIGELSAGQRQRLALARLLLQDAFIYLLDEPDANLDRAGIALVGEIVRELVARGSMVAVAAHTDELTSLPGVHVTLR